MRIIVSRSNTLIDAGRCITEAAQYMGVSPWFVELKLRSRELVGLKMCRHWTILREDMDRFLDAQRLGHEALK
jgi:excisionase family DNA binding protein